MKGRKPAPISRQISAGDPRKRGVKKLAEADAKQLKTSRGFPKCPPNLKGEARQQWELLTDGLTEAGLDRMIHSGMVQAACINFARAMEAENALTKDPLNPRLDAMARGRWAHVKSLYCELYATPASMARGVSEKRNDAGDADLMAILSAPREERAIVH
jgi:phage terminase small subunit